MHKVIKGLFITCSTYKKYMMMFVADAQWMQSCWDIATDSKLFGSRWDLRNKVSCWIPHMSSLDPFLPRWSTKATTNEEKIIAEDENTNKN